MGRERLIERVQIALAVDAEGARDVVEAVERALVEAAGEGLGHGHGLLRSHPHLAGAQLVEERNEHVRARLGR